MEGIDPWMCVGFLGQLLFFTRFVVQWIASERKRRVVVPAAYWYISIVGTCILLVYSVHLRNPVFMLGFGVTFFIYMRNIQLLRRGRRDSADSAPGNPSATTRDPE
jgi:lipid-A-disaccharide synthase-like uncharacterized protein